MNVHLSAFELEQLMADEPKFPADKPVWSPYALTKKGSFYSQIRPGATNSTEPKIHLHRLALVYKLRFIENCGDEFIAENLTVMEASHLMGNYIGHQRDFNPNNLALEYGLVNKSRDSCHFRHAMQQAKHALGSKFDREKFLKEFCLQQTEIEQEGLDIAAREINSQHVLSPVNTKDECCRAIHDPLCKAWNPVWGAIPDWVGQSK